MSGINTAGLPVYGAVPATALIAFEVPQTTGSAPFQAAALASVISGPQGGGSAVQQPALTGSTSEAVLGTVVIPAGSMGPNGYIRCTAIFSGITNNANNKSVRFRLGGLSGTNFSSATDTTNVSAIHTCEIHNRNSVAAQVGWGVGSRGTDGLQQFTSPQTGTIDTTVSQAVVVTAQLATGTDSITLESFHVEVVYRA
jgi:hypothetical protein